MTVALISLACGIIIGLFLEAWDSRRYRTYPRCSVCGRRPEA